MDEDKLRLIYVLKVGYNSKGEGLYEFIFSEDDTKIDVEAWAWDACPACDNALPPTEEYIDKVIALKTSSFDLFCLHEAVDREYMHGYHTIHALAYEIIPDFEESEDEEGFESYDAMMIPIDEMPLLVFHYGITLKQIKDMLYERRLILKDDSFIETKSINFN